MSMKLVFLVIALVALTASAASMRIGVETNNTLASMIGHEQASLIEMQVRMLVDSHKMADSPFYYEQYDILTLLDKITAKIAAETAAQNKKYDDLAASYTAEFNARLAANAESVKTAQSSKDASAAIVIAKKIVLDAANSAVVSKNSGWESSVVFQEDDDPKAQNEFDESVKTAADARDVQFAVLDKEMNLIETIKQMLPALENGSPSLLQTQRHLLRLAPVLIQVNVLASRFGVAEVPVDNKAEVKSINELLDKIVAKINGERAKAQAKYDADFARFKAVMDARKLANANAVEAAKAALDAAINAAAKATGEYEAAVESDNVNAGRLQAAADFEMADNSAAQSTLDAKLLASETDRQTVLKALRDEQDVVNAIRALLNALNEGKDPCAGITCVAKSQCHVAGECSKGQCSTPFAAKDVKCSNNGAQGACDGAGNCVALGSCNAYTSLSGDDRWYGADSHNQNLRCDQSDLAASPTWYRFTGSRVYLSTNANGEWRCGTHAGGWMNGGHPGPNEGVVTRSVCYHWSGNTCLWNNNIRVANCGGYYVYELPRPFGCHLRYCTA